MPNWCLEGQNRSGLTLNGLICGVAAGRLVSVRLVSFQFLGFAIEPVRQLFGISKNTAALTTRDSMNGQTTFTLPALYGALGAIEKNRDLLPRDKRFCRFGIFYIRRRHVCAVTGAGPGDGRLSRIIRGPDWGVQRFRGLGRPGMALVGTS